MESNQSAETVVNNTELLTEILIRLPIKLLVTFKSVSKQWLSLISNPIFTLSHTRYHHSKNLTPTALLLNDTNTVKPEGKILAPFFKFEINVIPLKGDTIPKIPLFHYFNAPGFHIIQSCNGLLLCSSYLMIGRVGLEHVYCICNPTTKQFKRLFFPSCEFKECLVSICMAFDPLKSSYYKVICVRRVGCRFEFYMYSSETDSWKPLDITFTLPFLVKFSVSVFCNGAVHWYSLGETSIYFDVDRECFSTMPMPQLKLHNILYFGESRGHLHLVVTKDQSQFDVMEMAPDYSGSQFDVMEMAPDYSGWFVRCHVKLDAIRTAFPDEPRFSISVLHVIRAQLEENSIVVICVGNKAISCNVHNGTLKKLYDLEPSVTRSEYYTYYTWNDAFQYFEILTSV